MKLPFFLYQLKKDGFSLIFWLLLFTLFRAIFLLVHSQELQNVPGVEIALSFWYGLRLSLKTAGAIVLVPFVLTTLLQTFFPSWPGRKIRHLWQGFCLFIFSFLFVGRFVYYSIFNSAYNIMIINGLHDDWSAILKTGIEEYHVLYILPIPFILAYLLYLTWKKLDQDIVYHEYRFSPKKTKLYSLGLCCILACLMVFIRFGGGFTYNQSINWANAGRLSSSLLNETVLDDAQALYRTYSAYKIIKKMTNHSLTGTEISHFLSIVKGNPTATSIDEGLKKTVTQPIYPFAPNQIFLILGESYGVWPFLPDYEPMHIVPAGSEFAHSSKGAFISMFLAQGTGTMPAVNGYLTGLPDTGLYPNYMKESYQHPYPTGIAYVMKKLGYKTIFWYGGFGEWQNVRHFALSQSFDTFFGAEDIPGSDKGAWGMPDKELFDAIRAYTLAHRGEKLFHFILTTSNHPPYTLPVDEEGYPRQEVAQHLPPTIAYKDEVLTEIGHFWYADHVMGDFVHQVEKEIPQSFFIITGDHSERFSFSKPVDIQTASAIPLIFYGNGVSPSWFTTAKVGMPIQIIPTLAELFGPPGFTYAAIAPSLFDTTYNQAFNHRLFAQDGKIEPIENTEINQQGYIQAARALAAQRMAFGPEIK